MLITEMLPLTKGKVKVCFEDGTDLVLYKNEIKTYSLEKGKEYPDEILQSIDENILIPRAQKRAMHLLEQMDYTEKQLQKKLIENGYSMTAVEAALDYVRSYHYLDDQRYAKTFVRMHCIDRSRMRLIQDLRGRGITEDIIEKALEEEYCADESLLIEGFIRKKGFDVSSGDQKERAKMYRFLASKGFSSHAIIRALHTSDS